jgi:2-polyprenyl-3-methyl-5-hydroxy-6-metoxy-1,4-benzoquinol methylase
MVQQGAPPSPVRIFQTLTSFQQSAALRAAIGLGLFTAIAEGHSDVAALAKKIGASEKGTRVLCDALVIMNFLSKNGAAYGLVPESAMFLNQRAPTYVGAAASFLVDELLASGAYNDFAASVKKGGSAFSEEGTVSRDNPIWVSFARHMASLMAMPAQLLAARMTSEDAGPIDVLDIAAGHGLYGIAFAQKNPQAKVSALDWDAVLQVAKENAAAAGVSARHRLLPGSAFEVDYKGPYDIVLLTNFLHHFDVPACEGLLKRLHAATRPGARLAILEFVPNDDRISPQQDAFFAVTMLATTAHGDAYTHKEYDAMLHDAGFARSEMIELSPLPQRVVIGYR